MSQGRRWVYTLHIQNDDYSDADQFTSALRQHPKFRGLAHQLEECPTTARIHVQGYVEFTAALRLAALKKISQNAHWEMAKGSREQCVAYCSKEDTALRIDESVALRTIDPVLTQPTEQGKRNDLLECAAKIAGGEWDLAQVHQNRPDLILKFSKGVNELFRFREQAQTSQRRELSVEVLWGDAGTGKTRYAWGEGEDVFILENSNNNNVWWDGYNGESTLIIDDFYGWIAHNLLLRILDIYPLRLDIKGGTTYARWTKVFITSNRHPVDWYKKFPWESDGALQRRIHQIWHTPMGLEWEEEKTGLTKKPF